LLFCFTYYPDSAKHCVIRDSVELKKRWTL